MKEVNQMQTWKENDNKKNNNDNYKSISLLLYISIYIMGAPDDDIEVNRGLRLAKVVEIIGAFLAAEEISILA